MARLSPLAELDFDHLDLRFCGGSGEALCRERAVLVAAAEITGTDFPNDIAAVLLMIGAEAALAGIVSEAAQLRPLIQGADGVCGQGAIAHRRDVERLANVILVVMKRVSGMVYVYTMIRLFAPSRLFPFKSSHRDPKPFDSCVFGLHLVSISAQALRWRFERSRPLSQSRKRQCQSKWQPHVRL